MTAAVKAVALGGGHGLHAALSALRLITDDITAVVTVADDGGSSGRIRREINVLPPGDLRMAVVALADGGPDGAAWADLLQHRLGGTGMLAGHPVGNLMLTALLERHDDANLALAALGRSVSMVGRVLPMSPRPLDLIAEIDRFDPDDPTRTRKIRGQSSIASTPGRVLSVSLLPAGAPACADAVDAVREADLVVLGPGSWFTSVIPHLLLRELGKTLASTSAHVLVVLNLVPQAGETDDYEPHDLLRLLQDHAEPFGGLPIDTVLADGDALLAVEELRRYVRGMGARLVVSRLAADDSVERHDPARLAEAIRDVLAGGDGEGRTHGDDRSGQGRVEPGPGESHVGPQGRTRHDAAIRRCPAPDRRSHRHRGRTGHRFGRPAPAQGDRRHLRPRLRGADRRGRRHPQGLALSRAGDEGRRAAGPPGPGLVDLRGRPVKGLPHHVVSGGIADAEAAWRGAFLAHGSLTEPGRACSLEITCPSNEAALALVGVGRRLGVSAKAREVRGGDRVLVRDGDAIGALLTRIGAHDSVLAWEERRMRREVRAVANRLANFDDANLRRSARAAVAAGARVQRAMEILGEDAPDHLLQAGRLRLEHKQASLEELGALSDPVMTKDAVAGRIRRLLAMADKRAGDLGIPDTESAVTAEMLAP